MKLFKRLAKNIIVNPVEQAVRLQSLTNNQIDMMDQKAYDKLVQTTHNAIANLSTAKKTMPKLKRIQKKAKTYKAPVRLKVDYNFHDVPDVLTGKITKVSDRGEPAQPTVFNNATEAKYIFMQRGGRISSGEKREAEAKKAKELELKKADKYALGIIGI